MKKNVDIASLVEETRLMSSRYAGTANNGGLETYLGIDGYVDTGDKV
jgi:hypothetical protein